MGTNEFPRGFTFGVATAAYQVEGHIENDWSEWERQGKCKDPNHRCGRGVDHWNLFDHDVQLAKEVGSGAFRISLEWARIEPVRGQVDEAAVDQYRQRLLRMKDAGIRPVVTLHHFTHPQWFHRETPWHEPSSVVEFRRYARICARILKGLDALVITFNEPMVLLLGGYIQGVIPPGITDGHKSMLALGNIARSHVAAREEILRECGRCEVGISQNMLAFRPDRWWHPLDRALTRLAFDNYNHAFHRALTDGELRIQMPGLASTRQRIEGGRDSVDFMGINYYTRAHLRFVPKPPFLQFQYRDVHSRGLTDIGWEDYSEGFSHLLVELHHKYGKPIWVTENGIDDRQGDRRPQYLYNHWSQMLSAVRQGADVRGYLYWSLMDNFEWLEGWGPRFGLYSVDFETLERRATPACHYFRRVAQSGVLVEPGRVLEPTKSEEPMAAVATSTVAL
ncbi:glycoside hydrolase family 1 protein [Archangium violaceum]|uniref:glycoside hydrolase family 1 protein n=1 Tax=Archangium violaceum TaxID=83451 RepID=UPI0036DD627C